MFEETNQTEEMMLPDELFADELTTEEEDAFTEEAEPVEVDEEVSVAEEVTPDGTPTSEEVANLLRIKYNGEEKDISMDEAKTLAQKGMNYDKILGERDQLADIIDRYAGAAGMTREQFMNHLEQNLADYSDGIDIAKLKEAYPGASEDILKEIARRDRTIKESERKEREAKEKADRETAEQKPWIDFFTRHPDVKAENLSEDLMSRVREGMTPTEAYLMLENEKLKADADIARQNKENLDRAVGSAKGNGGKVKKDPFLEGFNG